MNGFPLVRWVLFFLSIFFMPIMTFAQNDVKSFTLELALEIAMKENPRLLAAHHEVDAARGRSWTTWWPSDPSFTAAFEEIPTGQGLGSFGERRLAITQSIDFPLNIYFKNKLASNDINISAMNLEQVRLNVRADLKQAYVTFLAKDNLVNLAQQNLRLAQEFQDKAQTRYDVGEAPQLELIRAKVAATQSENELIQAQSELTRAQAALNALLARSSNEPIHAVDSLSYQEFDRSLDELKQQAFENHPRLRAADYEVSMAQQGRNLAWGSFLPTIEASAFSQNVGGNADLYGVEFGFSIPLWFPFRQRGNIQEAKGLLNASQYRWQNERNLLDAEIESAYAEVRSDQQQVEKYRHTLLSQADEVYRIALRSYEEGEVGYLELLEAQQTLIEVRMGYIDALTNYRAALAELERAAGVEMNHKN